MELNALGNDVAFHGLLLEAAELLEPLGDGLLLLFFEEGLTSLSNSVHKLRLEEVVEGVELKALMKELDVDLAGQAHQAHSLVLDLGDQGPVVFALSGNQFGDEVLAVGLGHGLTLAVKNIRQVVVVLLLGISDLDVGEHNHTGGEVGTGPRMDAADLL